MTPDVEPDLKLEIAHLLFIDVVGFSKLLVNEQIELMQQLNRIVRGRNLFGTLKPDKNSFASQPATAWFCFFSTARKNRCAVLCRLARHCGIDRRFSAHGNSQRPCQSGG